MKRFAGILILVAWLGGVTWYWRESVPLAATSSARNAPDTQVRTLTPSGDLTLVHSRFTNGPGTRVINCGPMEFWGFPECRKVRELFDQNDEIIEGPLPRSREVLIRRKGRLLVINSESGETIGELPDIPGARRFAMHPDNKQVLIDDNRDIRLYEFGQETPRWTAPMQWLRGPGMGGLIAAGLVTVSKRSQTNPTSSSGTAVLRLDTGELDSRFDHLGRIGHIRLAPNGRFALITIYGSFATRTPGRTVICDAASGEALWTFSGAAASNDPVFTADGDEVLGFELSSEKRLNPARWRSLDGSKLPPPSSKDLTRLRHLSADGRFIVRHPVIDGNTFINRTIGSINNFGAKHRLGFYLMNLRQGPALLEVDTGRVAGPLPADRAYTHCLFLPDRPALVCVTPWEILHYELPPHRNYWWLAGWTLIPPVLVIALVRFVQYLSQRRTRSTSAAPGANCP